MEAVEHAVKEDVVEIVGVFDLRGVKLWLKEVVTDFEGWRLPEPVVELVVEAVARILLVRVGEALEVLEGALVRVPVDVFTIVADRTADPETLLVRVEEAVTVELGEAVREPF